MKIIFFMSICAIVLASNFLNAAPNDSEEYLVVKSDEHPLLPCRCLKRNCIKEDGFKTMVIIEAEGKCSDKIACKRGGFCECKDNRCVRGKSNKMFEVKLNEYYPGIVCHCSAKGCRKEDGLNILRRIVNKNLPSFMGPCKSNGYCKCQQS